MSCNKCMSVLLSVKLDFYEKNQGNRKSVLSTKLRLTRQTCHKNVTHKSEVIVSHRLNWKMKQKSRHFVIYCLESIR